MKWKNWAGNVTAQPARIRVADEEADLVEAVTDARDADQRVRAVGTGHSFAALCATDEVLVSLNDSESCRITNEATAVVWAGTKIGSAAEALWGQGCSFENQGDIDVQTLAGAVSTGTHGTGSTFGSFSAKTSSIRLVTSDGNARVVDGRDPDLLRAAALSLGTLGLISEIGIEVVPQFHLREQTEIVDVEQCFESFQSLSAAHRHAEYYWLPGHDKCVVKTIDLSDGTVIEADGEDLPPPGTIERYLQPVRANKAYLVFRNVRTVPFLEMEYSVPLEAGTTCMREIRRLMQGRFPEIKWVTEYRTQESDSLMLSPAYGRRSATISVHDHPDGGSASESFFRACEQVFLEYDGRPHWGKLCFMSPDRRAGLFPEFEAFSTIRRDLDPAGLFLNDHLAPLFR